MWMYTSENVSDAGVSMEAGRLGGRVVTRYGGFGDGVGP